MKNTLKHLFLFSLLAAFSLAVSAKDFPYYPDPKMTPGKLCDRPDRYRYPEGIAYCDRDVDSETKDSIIAQYDLKFNYRIKSLPREDFKIDHFIPLCMGGSNDLDNLWPQHKSVWEVTDPIEPILCTKMAQGKISQKDAIKLLMEAKLNLENAGKVLKFVNKI
jgi:hypothetical protein